MTIAIPRIELKKFIGAPKENVFDAVTNPKLMALWMAPGKADVVESVVDLRVGGRYQIKMTGEMLGRKYDVVIGGVYRELMPGERLSFTWVYEDDEHRESVGDSVVTIELRTVMGGTELTLIHEKIATPQRREGHLWGWTNCLEKLEGLFAAKFV